jgi:hypothetical protein
MRGYATILGALSLVACATHPSVSESDAAVFMTAENRSRWSFPIGEYPEVLIPKLFQKAHRDGQKLEAVVVTQVGIHPVVYSIYLDHEIVLNGLHWGVFIAKGTIPYTKEELGALVAKMEGLGICRNWSGHGNVSGDLLVYRIDSGLRACPQSGAYYGGDTTLRDMFWSQYPTEKVNWTYQNGG